MKNKNLKIPINQCRVIRYSTFPRFLVNTNDYGRFFALLSSRTRLEKKHVANVDIATVSED
jgi:hypothetical protein